MKSLADLAAELLIDIGSKCGVDVSRDLCRLRDRVAHEGVGFLTLTLAEYGKDLDQALAAGRVVPGSFASFGKLRSGIPEFLRGFLHHVFDTTTGALRQRPSTVVILHLRQFCRAWSKVNLECSHERKRAAVDAFVSVDQTCRGFFQELPSHRREDVDEEAEPPWRRSVIGELYKRVAATIVAGMRLEDEDGNVPVRCTHGPGATVEGYTPNGKWTLPYWHSRLEEAGLTRQRACFGREEPLWGSERIGFVPVHVDPADEAAAKVVLVPKTQKSPRVIAVEPLVRQFAQQGLAAVLRSAIDHGRYTSGRINFRDQTVNQEKALRGSVDGRWATIDLKDASDRVGCDLVQAWFEEAPEQFWRLLWATRATRAKLPDGREVDLRKFASMGSALCFPVEALVFYTIALAARLEARGLPCTPATLESVAQDVYVYGDDICCPSDEAPTICAGLEAFGLVVNRRKSFWTGKFRESCGVDAFDGTVVTPIYLRRMPPANRADSSAIISTIATANALSNRGYERLARALRKSVERLLGGLPQVPEGSPALGWHGVSTRPAPKRWNRALQRWEHRCWVATAVTRSDPCEGEAALAKCLRRPGANLLTVEQHEAPWPLRRGCCDLRMLALRAKEIESGSGEHLNESATPYAVALKRRWLALL